MKGEFKYIIQKQEQPKVCFGSGLPRDTSDKGTSPFTSHYTLENHPNVAPNSYNTLESFKAFKTKPCSHSISKKGYGGLARFGKQIAFKNNYPSPFAYDTFVFPRPVGKSKYPFDTNSKRQTFLTNTNPGPGMYVSTKESMIVEHNFGGRVKMRLGVDLKCCGQNRDICNMCGQRPIGDYWHSKNAVFLCRVCMAKEFEEQIKYKRTELKLFRKIRDCSLIHLHEGTTAKIWLMHPTVVTQWSRREAYLSTYLKE